MNTIYLEGLISKDVEVRSTQSGMNIASFSIAVNHSKKVNNEWVNETSFFDVKAFGNTADKVSRMSKGALIILSGSLKQDKWQDKEGNNRYSINILADSITECVKNKKTDAAQVQQKIQSNDTVSDPWQDESVPF